MVAKLQTKAASSVLAAHVELLGDAAWEINPTAFSGWTHRGAPLTSALYGAAPVMLERITHGLAVEEAHRQASNYLTNLTRTTISDAGRDAATADLGARPCAAYVRMVQLPACPRCIILAGRIYYTNAHQDAFQRHPGCDCVHVPTNIADQAEAIANGLIDDPREAFQKMIADPDQLAMLERSLGKPSVQALIEGADPSQVVNAKRGQTRNGNFTTEGTTRHGYAGRMLKDGQKRMTPKLMLEQADGDRERFRELLQEHGYIIGEAKPLTVPKPKPPTAVEAGSPNIRQQMDDMWAAHTDANGGGKKPPTSGKVGGAMDDNLPDQYRNPDVPFTRVSRPRATFTNASHAVDKHSYDSPPKPKVTYFPKHYFGTDGNDVESAKDLMDFVTYRAEPFQKPDDDGWYFHWTVRGVRLEVPIRETHDGSDLEARTIIPLGGIGVRRYENGRYSDVLWGNGAMA